MRLSLNRMLPHCREAFFNPTSYFLTSTWKSVPFTRKIRQEPVGLFLTGSFKVQIHPASLPPKRAQLINWFGCDLWLILEWANSLLSGMVRNLDLYFGDIVSVVQLW